MIHHKICDDCWSSFETEYQHHRLCWDCERVRFIRKHPSIALEDEHLMRFAFYNGLIITRTDEGIKVRDIFTYEDVDERWRSDLHKIKRRARQKGKLLLPADAWNRAARASMRRAAAKYRRRTGHQ